MQLITSVLVHVVFRHLSIVLPSNSYIIKNKNKKINILEFSLQKSCYAIPFKSLFLICLPSYFILQKNYISYTTYTFYLNKYIKRNLSQNKVKIKYIIYVKNNLLWGIIYCGPHKN